MTRYLLIVTSILLAFFIVLLGALVIDNRHRHCTDFGINTVGQHILLCVVT